MGSEPPIIDYRVEPQPRRMWGLARGVWWLVAGFCAFLEFAGDFANNGRVNGWGDIVYMICLAVVGVIAFINAVRASMRS